MKHAWFNLVVTPTLTRVLGTHMRALDAMAFSGQAKQTRGQRKAQVDKFCSNKDIISYILAMENDELIGAVTILKRTLTINGKQVALGGLGGMCTREDKRERGVATALLARAMTELEQRGSDLVYICTNIHNPWLVRFYERVGFVRLGKPYTFLGKSGKRYTEEDGMIAPMGSSSVFQQILSAPEVFDIGVGNW